MRLLPVLASLVAATSSAAFYAPLREYSGNTFFDAWDYWGNIDNTTLGNVTFLDRPKAMEQRLTYIDDNGHAIIRVDNTTDIPDAAVVNRPSIRITTQDSYEAGSLIVIDVAHMPTGCSLWPSFWTLGTGKEWPHAGEIDIIEGINLMSFNQMALHSDPGCVQALNPNQTGKTLNTNCASSQNNNRGCIVAEAKPNSFGVDFNNAGGGVFATQLDESGVFMWFWGRSEIPEQITTATSTTNIDVSTFGVPSASYPLSGCNYTQFFTPQQLVILITLCGHWAGVPQLYSQTCPGTCISNVIGPGSPTYDEAYWDIAYVRTYFAQTGASSLPATSSFLPTSISQTPSAPITTASSQTRDTGSQGNEAFRLREIFHMRKLLIIVNMLSLLPWYI